MKRLYLLATFILLHSSFSMAQEWFPVGATWHYGWSFSIGGPTNYYAKKYVVVKDTVFLNRPCKKIYSYDNQKYSFRYDSANMVFYSNISDSIWNLLYDFNIEAGDTVYYPQFLTGDTTIPIYYNVIDSVYNTIINNDTLKSYTSSTNAYFDMGVCCDGFAMSETEVISGGEIIWTGDWQDFWPFGLRCYEDTILGFYQNPNFNLDCDTSYTLVGLTQGLENKSSIKVYPVPAENYLSVSILTESSERGIFKIHDLNGKEIETYGISEANSTLDISNLEPGMYIWEFRNEVGRVRDKLIIE